MTTTANTDVFDAQERIALAFLATVLLGILAIGLLRNLRALAAAIGRFQEDVGSTAAKIAEDGAQAAARLEEIRARFGV